MLRNPHPLSLRTLHLHLSVASHSTILVAFPHFSGRATGPSWQVEQGSCSSPLQQTAVVPMNTSRVYSLANVLAWEGYGQLACTCEIVANLPEVMYIRT